jgi:hypothetical protein
MRAELSVIVCAIFGFSLAIAACSTSDDVSQRSSLQTGAAPAQRMPVEPSSAPNSAIRSVDFANFTYPVEDVVGGMKSITLHQGRYEGDNHRDPINLAYRAYCDVTGDGMEEAIIVLEVSVKGTAIPHIAYIYGLRNDNPQLLWTFETGDRGDGGLRQIGAENGELIIELYGKDKLIGKDLYGGEGGACCPKFFTRARYEWLGDHFQQKGTEETLPNPENHGSPVMEAYP